MIFIYPFFVHDYPCRRTLARRRRKTLAAAGGEKKMDFSSPQSLSQTTLRSVRQNIFNYTALKKITFHTSTPPQGLLQNIRVFPEFMPLYISYGAF